MPYITRWTAAYVGTGPTSLLVTDTLDTLLLFVTIFHGPEVQNNLHSVAGSRPCAECKFMQTVLHF